jgi:hypothetical protein
MSNKLLPDLLLILSTFFLFLSIFNSLRVAKSFCKNSVKSSKVLDFCRLYSDIHSPTITNLKFKLAAGNDQSTSNNSNDILADDRAKK